MSRSIARRLRALEAMTGHIPTTAAIAARTVDLWEEAQARCAAATASGIAPLPADLAVVEWIALSDANPGASVEELTLMVPEQTLAYLDGFDAAARTSLNVSICERVATYVPTGDHARDVESARTLFRAKYGCEPIVVIPDNGRG